MHDAYHSLIIGQQSGVLWRWTERDGRLRELFISRLEMDLAIRRARAWCASDIADAEYVHAAAAIERRLPAVWANDTKRCAFALRAFDEICCGRYDCRHPKGRLGKIARKLGRGPEALDGDRLDFYLLAAAMVLDDDAWAEAMTGKDSMTGEQVTEGEQVGSAGSLGG